MSTEKDNEPRWREGRYYRDAETEAAFKGETKLSDLGEKLMEWKDGRAVGWWNQPDEKIREVIGLLYDNEQDERAHAFYENCLELKKKVQADEVARALRGNKPDWDKLRDELDEQY